MRTRDPGAIAIIGSGPTGLGAAWRLKELGHDGFMVYEASDDVGGLATSFVDDAGFTWDVGGHVQFSHYDYFDRVMDEALPPEEWLHHERESWVWMQDRFIPYPFQYNIHRLPRAMRDACLAGLEAIQGGGRPAPANFREWILATFGEGVAEAFMFPYNAKVWAHPLERMSSAWVGERVAPTDLARVKRNIESGTDDKGWGPNNTFRYPLHGGTGAIWRAVADRIGRGRIETGKRVARVDPSQRTIRFEDGSERSYDVLLNTSPLDRFAPMVDGLPSAAVKAAGGLRRSSTHVVGIGIKGAPPETLAKKCWMYFPEADCPFYRITVFSHYSPYNVPRPGEQWSLMAEVSESPTKPVDAATVVDDVVQGCLNTKLVASKQDIVSRWHRRFEHGYPVPTVDRDRLAAKAHAALERHGIFSRGRFGAWKYEVSNQDHSFMQGVEWAGRVLRGEDEPTFTTPHAVNSGRKVASPARD